MNEPVSAYDSLSLKHKLFVKNYIRTCFDAKQAYRMTYPKAKERTAEVNGYRLSKASGILAAIKALSDGISEEQIKIGIEGLAKGASKESVKLGAYSLLADIKSMKKSQNITQQTIITPELLNSIRNKALEKKHELRREGLADTSKAQELEPEGVSPIESRG